jgi:uncharacterized protein YdhG (YjbR/CyaY superfamily)
MPPTAPPDADAYLDQLPPERRAVVSAVRNVIRRQLPEGYEEVIASGMIGYVVPLARYPGTYNGQPLSYVGLAAQKRHYALYLTDAYHDPERAAWLRDAFARHGTRLDMGKSCLRFKSLADVPLDVIGEFVAARSVAAFIAQHERSRGAADAAPATSPRAARRNARSDAVAPPAATTRPSP